MSRRQLPFVTPLTEPGVLEQSVVPSTPEEPLADGGTMDFGLLRAEHEARATGDPTLAEQLGAAFSRLNTVPMVMRGLSSPSFDADPNFDPTQYFTGDDLGQPAHVRGRFLEAKSLQELEWLRAQNRRQAHLDRIIEAGPAPALLAGAIASVVDPINLLPLGWVASPLRAGAAATRAGRLASGVAEGALIGVAAGASVEPFIRMDDPFRTMEDTMVDLLVSGVFGAGIGGMAGALSGRPRSPLDGMTQRNAADAEAGRVGLAPETVQAAVGDARAATQTAARLTEGEVPAAASETLIAPRPTEAPPGAGGSVGAAMTQRDIDASIRAIRPELNRVLGEGPIRAVFNTLARLTMDAARYPGLQLAVSRFYGVRDFIASVADIGVHTRAAREISEDQMEAAMKAAEDRGFGFGTAEARSKVKAELMQLARDGVLTVTDHAPLFSRIQLAENSASLRLNEVFDRTRAEVRAAGVRMSKAELDDALGSYAQFTANPAQFGGAPPVRAELVPHFDAALKEARAMMRSLFDEAQQLGIIPEGVTSADIAYWPLTFDREALLADQQGARNALFRTLKEQQQRAEEVVRPYEEAVASWRDQLRLNRMAAAAARQAKQTGQDPQGLYLQWYRQRRALGRHNGVFKRLAAKMRRDFGEDLAPGQTLDQWVDEQAARGVEIDAEYKAFYESKLAEYPQVRADEVARAQAEGRTPDPDIVNVSPEQWATAEADAFFVRDLGEAVRIAEYIEARTTLQKAQQAYEGFRRANADEWRRMTRPFVDDADKARFPGGYDMPEFVGPRPLAPENYERHRRLIRNTVDNAEARLGSDYAIWREVDEMFNALTVADDPYRFAQLGMRGHLKQRGLEVNWSHLQPYTIRSFNGVVDRYMTMVSRDIETVRTFGTWKTDEIINKLATEPRIEAERLTDRAEAELRKAEAGGDPAAVASAKAGVEKAKAEAETILRDFQRDAEVMKMLIAQARGTFISPPKTIAEAKARSAIQTGMSLMFMARMGSAVLAQIGDFTKATLEFGLVRFVGAFTRSLAQSLGELARGGDPGTKRLMQMFGTMAEGNLLNHTRIMFDVAPAPLQGPVGRVVNRMTPTFSRLTLMPFMNDVMRRAAVTLVQDDLVRMVNGNAGDAAARRLWAQSGISPDERATLRELIKNHAREDWNGNMDLHIEEWMTAHPDLALKVRAAVHLGAQRATVTPSAADAPIWTQTTLGRPVTQFKRFIFASMPQLLLPAMQSPGGRKVEVALAALMFGTISVIARDLNTRGEIKERSEAEWVADALDMSGLTSMLTEIDATLSKINPHLSARNQLIGEIPARYFERSLLEQLGGPLLGAIDTNVRRAGAGVAAAFRSDMDVEARHIAAGRGLMPYQNHLILRHPLDVAEAAIGGRVTGPFGWMGEP